MIPLPAADSPPTAKRQTLKWGGHFGFSSTCWATECLRTRITDSLTEVQRGCIEVSVWLRMREKTRNKTTCIIGCLDFTQTLTEEEREKLDGFLLKCHRPQKRKNRCLTVYADSAEIFRAKRRQREFALLQSKAPKTETKRNAKVRKGKEPKELDNDEQAATARADSPAAASPAKRSPPASLFDLKLKGTANQHSFEKEMKEINAARPDDEQHQQQQVETPKHLENMIEETKMEEDGLTSKPPNLQPLEAQDIQEAAYELNESRRSVTASRRSSPRRLEAKSHEASSETRSASSCAVEPHEVNVGEDEAQGDQQTAVRQTPLKNHIKRKQ
ncbi:hypothetical protein Emag_001868 [Eimeria magna]